ncbi:MAG TPA: PAS domain S-box protein [Anaerolineales bacterium]|nr:PAS domain S-box protein [Anaerolineales bacterium]
MQKGILQVAGLRLLIRPYLQFTTTALVILGLLGGWAEGDWLMVSGIFIVLIGTIIWIGRQARLHGAQLAYVYASAVINLIAASVIVLLTGGPHSPFWLLFIVGAIVSAMSCRGRAAVNLERLNAGVAAVVLIGPGLLDWPPERSLITLAGMQVLMLFMSSLMVRSITTLLMESADKLGQGEERYRRLIDTARDVIFTLSTDGRFTALNPSFESFTGWSRDEWLGRSFDEMVLEEDRAAGRDRFNRILNGETLRAIRLRIHTRSQRTLVVELNISPELRDGQVIGLLGIARDMTEEQHAEDALKESEKRFRALIENSSDAISLISGEGIILYESPSVSRILGYSPEELVGRKFSELLHPDDLPQVIPIFSRILEQPYEAVTASVRCRHKNGAWLWIEGIGKNLLAEPGLQAIVVNYRDVTERRQAEEALRESEERYRSIFQTSGVSIWEEDFSEVKTALNRLRSQGVTDFSTYFNEHPGFVREAMQMLKVIDVNEITLKLYGARGKSELLGSLDKIYGPDALKTFKDMLNALVEGRPYFEDEVIDRTLQGGHINLWRTIVFPAETASFKSVLVCLTDITARKQAEVEIRRQAETMTTLYETTRDLVMEYDLARLLHTIVERAARLLNVTGGGLYLCEPELGQVRCVVSYNTLRDYSGTVLRYGEGAAGQVAQTGEPLIIHDYRSWEGRTKAYEEDETFHAILSAPLKWQGEVIGVIHVLEYGTERRFTQDDQNLVMSFANQAAIAVQNARLYTRIQNELAERRAAEEALSESRAQLSGIIESAMDAIITLDAEQHIILFNAAAEQMFGYGPGEVIGRPIDLLIPARFRDIHRQHIHDFGQTGLTARSMRKLTALVGLRSDGGEFPIEASISQMSVRERKLYTVIIRDITERIQAEEGLRAAESRYRTLVEQLPIVVYVNPASEISSTVYVSPQIKPLLGYTQEEWLADPKFWSRALHPEDYQRVMAEVERVDRSGEPFDAEYRMIARHGRVIWVHDQATLLRDVDGHPLLWQGLMADITARKLAEDQIKRQISHLKALRVIDMTITSSTDMHLSLQIVLKQALAQLQVDAADILLLNSITYTLEFAEGMGFRTKGIERSSVRLGDAYTGRAALERRVMTIHDLREEGLHFPRAALIEGESFTSYQAVPLVAKGEVKGILEVFLRQAITPDQEWQDFLEALAGQAALAIDNSTLFESLQRSHIELSLAYETTLEGWSAALDLRDKETEGHTRRVVDLTLRLAEHMGIKDKELAHIRRGALLHDIGKMGVPDRILLKEDDLTSEEWEIMERHPVYAYELLSRIEYLRPALAIPHSHHEKWNGNGYPRGLKGEEIPLEARIFAVVDVYDAISSDRPYRPAWPREKALEHIKSLSGEDFDPKVVSAFLEMLAQSRRSD